MLRGLGKSEVREKILAKAQQCFTRYGYKKTSMDDIARAAGKTKSALYYYFKSKEEVVEAIANIEIDAIDKDLDEAIHREKDPCKRLYEYILVRITAVNKLASYFNVAKDDYIENYACLEKIRSRYDKEEQARIGSILRYGVEQGVFVIKDIAATAHAFMFGMKGLEVEWLERHDLSKLKKNMHDMMNIVLYGLVKR